MTITPGATSQSTDVRIVDDAGLAVTGLVAATMPAITWSRGNNTAATAITLSDLALITTAWTSGGVKERSGGVYRLDLPNAVVASAAIITLIAEASGKHLIAPPIEVAYKVPSGTQDMVDQFPAGTRIAASSGTVTAVTDTKNFTITFSGGDGPSVANQFVGQTLEIYNPLVSQERASARIVSHGTVDSQPIAFVVETDILTAGIGQSVAIIIDSPLGASSGGTFAGSYAVTVHVVDGSAVAIVGASVTLTDGVISDVKTTNSSGNVSYSVNGTYTLTITKAGYSYTPTTETLTAAATITRAMTAIVIPGAGVVGGASVYAYARGIDGVVSEGKTFFIRLVSSNTNFDLWNGETIESSASDSTGYAARTVRLGASAQASLDGINWTSTFTVSTDPYHLQEIVGTDWD